MRRPFVLSLALLAACGAPDVQPLAVAKRLEPEKAVPKDRKTPAKVAPTPPPAPPGPYRREGDARTQTDDLTFWGWSADGTKYAFEVHDHGPGATTCEGSYTLFVVDATRDAYADGVPLKVEHRKKEDEAPCDDLAAQIERLRPPVLARHGIDIANQRPPIVPAPITTTTGREKHPMWSLVLGGGIVLRATLEVLHGGRDNAGEPGAAYTLTLARDGADPVQVEPGKRRRPFVWRYSLDGGLAFRSPDGRHLAILVAMTQLSFEGDRHTFLSNGLALPPAWIPADDG